jgi:hypothetical protein
MESEENDSAVSLPSHKPWKSIKPIPTFPPPRRPRGEIKSSKPAQLRATHSEGKVFQEIWAWSKHANRNRVIRADAVSRRFLRINYETRSSRAGKRAYRQEREIITTDYTHCRRTAIPVRQQRLLNEQQLVFGTDTIVTNYAWSECLSN